MKGTAISARMKKSLQECPSARPSRTLTICVCPRAPSPPASSLLPPSFRSVHGNLDCLSYCTNVTFVFRTKRLCSLRTQSLRLLLRKGQQKVVTLEYNADLQHPGCEARYTATGAPLIFHRQHRHTRVINYLAPVWRCLPLSLPPALSRAYARYPRSLGWRGAADRPATVLVVDCSHCLRRRLCAVAVLAGRERRRLL